MMTRLIDLREYKASGPHALSVAERDALRQAIPSIAIEPSQGTEGAYTLTPGSIVGAVEIGDLSARIEPKIGVPQLLSLACYAMDAYRPQEQRPFDFEENMALPDALALALASHARRAFSRGLLHGYRTEEEALYTVRGRIRFDEQIRRRYGVPMPVEVRYDEFTDDVLANRLVKAAALRLGAMRLRSRLARRGLGWILGTLDNVSIVSFPRSAVPELAFDRLNDHYRGVVVLSRLILRHRAFEAGRGTVRASGFLMDMNVVFQDFVTTALREALGVSARTLCSDSQLTGDRRVYLEQERRVSLKPDLSWWYDRRCMFVGDAKYKAVSDERVPNADLYQLLAYTTTLDLPGGLLVYAKGEADPVTHQVRHAGKRLEIGALDLSGTLEAVLERVGDLALKVKTLRDEARSLRPAA